MTSSSRLIAGVRVGVTVLTLALPALTYAQEVPPTTMKPVEVVATRSAEAPHDVPVSIEVIPGDLLRARGANTLRDALSLAAGVAVAPGGDGGPASAVPEFWGLREFDAFLLVVDNIPWGGALNPAIATASLQDIERIEILRGPAPVTYGATSFVGVIHIVHKSAAEQTRYLQAFGGSYGSGGMSLDMGVPLGSWTSRASIDAERAGFKDDNTGFDRLHVSWRAGSASGAWFKTDVSVVSQDPASPHPRQGAALSSAVPIDANHNPDGAYLDETRVNVSGGFERTLSSGATWTSTASLTHATQKMFRGFLTSVTNTPNNATGLKEDIEINDVYLDTHLLWGSASPFRFLAGADALIAQGEADGETFSYTAPVSGVTRANFITPLATGLDAEDERAFFGAYGSMEWRPTERFSASAGLRLNSTTEKRGEGAEVTNTRVSGSVGAMFGLWQDGVNHLRAFANYRDTFKPAAFDFGLAENEGVLEPETSTAYELGVKLRTMEGKVDVEASWFDMDFENLVVSTIINNLPALANVGKTRFKGFELATDIQLPNAVFARASYSFHDGKFVDYEQDFDGELTQVGGNRFEMSPRTLYSAGLVLAPERGFIASVGFNYTGDRYMNKRNTALAPSFSTYDAGIGYRTERAEFRIDGRNLGDARDAVSESEFGDAQYYRMAARSVRFGVLLKY